MRELKPLALRACWLAAWVLLPPVVDATPGSGSKVVDTAFHAAVNDFKQGRTSTAYGRFLALADQGNLDAARIVLFMHRYGPVLFGKHWDIGVDGMQEWTALTCAPASRFTPEFRPVLQTAEPRALGGLAAQPPRR